MAVNLANIFMSKFEKEMLDEFQSIHGLRPALWLRFIDDIFFIWDNDEISLQSFLKFCNSYSTSRKIKSTINFTFNYSKNKRLFFLTLKFHFSTMSWYHNFTASPLQRISICKETHFTHLVFLNPFQNPNLFELEESAHTFLTIGFMLPNFSNTFPLEDSTELNCSKKPDL